MPQPPGACHSFAGFSRETIYSGISLRGEGHNYTDEGRRVTRCCRLTTSWKPFPNVSASANSTARMPRTEAWALPSSG